MSDQQTTSPSRRVLLEKSYEQELAESIAAKEEALAKELGIPLWMLRGFPAQSSEPDQDDPLDE